MSTNLALILFAIFLIATISAIIAMILSLAKQGDERRKTIIEKASTKRNEPLYHPDCDCHNLCRGTTLP